MFPCSIISEIISWARESMQLLISQYAQFQRIKCMRAPNIGLTLRCVPVASTSHVVHISRWPKQRLTWWEKRARALHPARDIFATACRTCPTTGVLTVFCLDRVERGPCQIPASWLWLRFIRKSHFHDQLSEDDYLLSGDAGSRSLFSYPLLFCWRWI